MVTIKTYHLICFYKGKKFGIFRKYENGLIFKFEIIYFYNVYGPRQITTGSMATVIGIFEEQYKLKLPLTVVKALWIAIKKIYTYIRYCKSLLFSLENVNKHYSISNKKSYSIIQVAKMFKSEIKFLPFRKGKVRFSTYKYEFDK